MVGLQDPKVTKYMSVCARGGCGVSPQRAPVLVPPLLRVGVVVELGVADIPSRTWVEIIIFFVSM